MAKFSLDSVIQHSQDTPLKGTWGRRGCTHVRLEVATEPSVRQALIAAWRNTAPKRLAQTLDEE